MQALIMAAGYGTRLEPLTLAVPKPLVLIVNKPTIQHNLELLRFYGITEITANLHYYPEQIQNCFGNGENYNVNLRYSYEEELLGTAGGVWKMGRAINDIQETFLVLSSDALTDINLAKLIAFHRKKKALVTLGLSEVEDTSNFGVVVLDAEQKIVAFQEKPAKREAKSKLVNAGIYVMEPRVLDLIPSDTFYDFGKQLFPLLVEQNEKIFGYKMDEYWSDVGNLEHYRQANFAALSGKVKVSLPGKQIAKNQWVGKGTKILDGTEISGKIAIGSNCHIGKNVKLKGDNIIGDFSIIEDGAEIENSILWPDAYLGKKAKVHGSIVAAWCQLDSKVTIEKNCVIANRCRIRSDSTIAAGSHLAPDTII
ncbi:MAG: NDP-sugar synthase [Candidatus Margulisiibacteriota bacterium]